MIKKYCTLLFVLLFVFINPEFSFSSDSSFYCVPLKNFSENIYSGTTTNYKVVINGSEFTLPDTSTQVILSKNKTGDSSTLILKAGISAAANKNNPSELNNFLSDSRLLNLDDPDIMKLKQRFINSRDIINDVENYVYQYISNKTIGLPIISASEILKDRTGDCTEHTVLTVAILRACGVPARALMGMVLSEEFEGSRNVFVYHMWAEAFVNGRWILVDSTVPGPKHWNRYIAFAYHHLMTEMPLPYLKAVSAMKNFSVEYLK